MADLEKPNWETCTEPECIGVRLPASQRCWTHADDQEVNAALKRLGEHGELDARGVPLTAELLQRLLTAAPRDDQDRAVLADAQFDEATFQGSANFDEVTFGDAEFEGATFQGRANFDRSTFQRYAGFAAATFQGFAWFNGATFGAAEFEKAAFQNGVTFDMSTFQGRADFGETSFHDGATFHEATFHATANFGSATFQRFASFDEATFNESAWFAGAIFQHGGSFEGATFHGSALFNGTFGGIAWFHGATFHRERKLGSMLVHKRLVLDETVFHERVQIEVSAAAVCCRRARFLSGVQLRVRWAEVALDDADLAAPSILTGMPAFCQEGRWARAVQRLHAAHSPDGRPRLVSLRRADVAGLTVAGVDLRACRFAGAHHLDQLRIEEAHFSSTPRSWRWTTRQTIAEEHHWRAAQMKTSDPTAASRGLAIAEGHGGWYRRVQRAPEWLELESPTPAQIAGVYRALRKGREDNKDEPGAADFYYGEMEMRRHAKLAEFHRKRRHGWRGTASAAVIEAGILWLYWLISGYGLRAWRALAALAVVVVLAGLGFACWGFTAPDQPAIRPVAVDARGTPIFARELVRRPAGLDELPTAIRFSAQAATALLRGPDQPLTAVGEWLQIVVRLIGPVLLGLAALSIRGRVKR